MIEIVVHNHALKHGLKEEDIEFAWKHFIRQRRRAAPCSEQIIAVGVTKDGDVVEMVAVEKAEGLMVYHALTPPTGSMLRELGLARR